mmetsp:Transcript_387/g.1150  ORF Transcript_387/g.1150 Transcript_387/m.1150 type:complete len:228 (-) Transcript_387:255-938(-)
MGEKPPALELLSSCSRVSGASEPLSLSDALLPPPSPSGEPSGALATLLDAGGIDISRGTTGRGPPPTQMPSAGEKNEGSCDSRRQRSGWLELWWTAGPSDRSCCRCCCVLAACTCPCPWAAREVRSRMAGVRLVCPGSRQDDDPGVCRCGCRCGIGSTRWFRSDGSDLDRGMDDDPADEPVVAVVVLVMAAVCCRSLSRAAEADEWRVSEGGWAVVSTFATCRRWCC